MRIYRCEEHPEKVYTSWRKFRGHWSTKHRGEEVGEREEYRHEVDKDEVIEEKKERREEKKEAAGVKETLGEEGGLPEQFILPEEPLPRLARILQVHGVPEDITSHILGIFQLHPGYQTNPVNLHYLLTARLPKRLHPSIPMMISAFTTTDSGYPEGMPMMMGPGGMGPGVMPPYMMGGGYGGGYPSYNPMTYGLPPYFRPPPGGRVGEEELGEREKGRGRGSRVSEELSGFVAMIGALKELGLAGGGSEGEATSHLRDIAEGMKDTVAEIVEKSREEKEAIMKSFSVQMEGLREESRRTAETLKDAVHDSEKGRLQDRIADLESAKAQETSEGLGSMLREAGEGLGQQVEGVRQSIDKGLEKIGGVVDKVVAVEMAPGGTKLASDKLPPKGRSTKEARELMEAEEQVMALAQALETGQGGE